MKIEIKYPQFNCESYRFNRVQSLFNAEKNDVHKIFELDIENDSWNLGLVVGPSGSGKTSLGKKIFKGVKPTNLYDNWAIDKPIIDCIGMNNKFDSVTAALAGVGLGDVPSWLKPFNLLSNGQQYRAGLARVICEVEEDVVIDEFTSVVDRQIAKIGALAFGKAWKRKSNKAVLLSCHYDVIEWLQPDWVFDTASGELKKKVKSEKDPNSNWKFGRSTEVIGSHLKSIII